MKRKRGNVTVLKVAIYILGIVVLCLCLFALPPLAKYTAETYPEYAYLRYPVLFGLYATAAPFFYALFQSLKLLRLIENDAVFSDDAVEALSIIKRCACIIAILYIIGMLFLAVLNALHPGIALIGFAILFTTVVIMMFAAVLEELLKNVITIKTENELTI